MRLTRIFILCFLVTMMLLVISGCTKKSDEDNITKSGNENTINSSTEEITASVRDNLEDDEELVDAFALKKPEVDSEKIYICSWDSKIEVMLDCFEQKYPEYTGMIEIVKTEDAKTPEQFRDIVETMLSEDNKQPSIILMPDSLVGYFLVKDSFLTMEDIGITKDMCSMSYQYTLDYATISGELKGLAATCNPGGFIYRTDIAEEVLGVSEPEDVQDYVQDWDSFVTTAQLMKDAGYFMLSGNDDIQTAFLDQNMIQWVDENRLNIDDNIYTYLEMSKFLWDNGYTCNTDIGNEKWTENIYGNVFGYFGGSDFIDSYLKDYASELYGARRICPGPSAMHYDGTFFGVTDMCQNKELAALFLFTVCCDDNAMYDLCENNHIFVNNVCSIQKAIEFELGVDEAIGMQSPYETFNANAGNLKLANATIYDRLFFDYLREVSKAYNEGRYSSLDEAIDGLKNRISTNFKGITIQ